jgi:hypothetical protein
MARCGGGFGDDACGAGDKRLHARHPHEISRIRIGGRDPGQLRAAAPATRLETALAAWEVQAHRTPEGSGCPNM